MAYFYQELRRLSKDEVIREYNRIAPHTEPALALIREEIARRDFEEQNQHIESMSRQIRNMTVVITVLTVINVIAVVFALWTG